MDEKLHPPKLLSGLTSEEVKIVLQSAERRTCGPNDVIVTAGHPATTLFQVTEGTAKYFRLTKQGDEVVLWWLSRGDTFGIGSLLRGGLRYIGTAQAVDTCELLVWGQERIRPLSANYHPLLENALRIVLYYLAAYADRLVGLIAENAEQRLAHALLHLTYRTGEVRSSGVELAITNEDLSRLANISTFTASRHLKKWERQGVLEKSRGKINVLSPESLLID